MKAVEFNSAVLKYQLRAACGDGPGPGQMQLTGLAIGGTAQLALLDFLAAIAIAGPRDLSGQCGAGGAAGGWLPRASSRHSDYLAARSFGEAGPCSNSVRGTRS
jgi:hypothetical protein